MYFFFLQIYVSILRRLTNFQGAKIRVARDESQQNDPEIIV